MNGRVRQTVPYIHWCAVVVVGGSLSKLVWN